MFPVIASTAAVELEHFQGWTDWHLPHKHLNARSLGSSCGPGKARIYQSSQSATAAYLYQWDLP